MKAKQKRKHLEEEGDKIKEKMPEEEAQENNGADGQNIKAKKPKKPKKNRLLACLRRAWRAITGCVRRRTSNPKKGSSKELPGPSGVNMAESKANMSAKVEDKEEAVEKSQSVADNDRRQWMESSAKPELQKQNINIHSVEDTDTQYDGSQNDDEQNGDLEAVVSSTDQKQGKDKEENDTKLRSDFNSEKSSSDSWHLALEELGSSDSWHLALEELGSSDSWHLALEELGSSNDTWYSALSNCWVEQADQSGVDAIAPIPQEVLASKKESDKCHRSIISFQNGNLTPSHICTEEPNQSGAEAAATVPLSEKYFTFYKFLGFGSYGEVFLGIDKIQEKHVAIKAMDKRSYTHEGCSFAERNILEISHQSPHLIHGLGAFHTPTHVFYVMELAARGSLHKFIREHGPFDTSAAQFMVAAIICGTEFLHKNGIIHRDLKPGNILLSAEGRIKITDFGLSAMGVFGNTEKKGTGTFGYAAPEMMFGHRYGPGADYFSIGVILYMLFTGRQPFPGIDYRSYKHRLRDYTPPYPDFLKDHAVNILKGLLCINQYERLGVSASVRKHPFFSTTNWEDVEAGKDTVPEIMTIDPLDMSIGDIQELEDYSSGQSAPHQKMFNGFSFVYPEWSQYYHPVIVKTEKHKSWLAKLFSRRRFKNK